MPCSYYSTYPEFLMKNIKQNGKNNTIFINYKLICFKFGIADSNSAKKKAFDVLYQRRARAAQEQRYSTLEVEHYVFELKCLVPAPLWLVRNPG